MELRSFGKTGWQVSAIGFGAWGIGGAMWAGSDDEASLQALGEALAHGCTFIDTALSYGQGHSERLFGRALAARDDAATVATKVPPRNRLWPARAGIPLRDVFPADHVERCAAESVANLGRPVDLLQLHVWRDDFLHDPDWPVTERAISRLLGAGTVRAFGISINDHEPDSALEAVSHLDLVSSVQVIYNIWDQRPAERLFPACRRRNVAVIARVPLDEGGLTGKITALTPPPAGDWRTRYFTPPRIVELERRVRQLEPVVRREASTLAEGALRFCLSHQDVSVVIPGMRTPAHARANCAVADGRLLSPALLAELRGHAWPRNWYPSSATPGTAQRLLSRLRRVVGGDGGV